MGSTPLDTVLHSTNARSSGRRVRERAGPGVEDARRDDTNVSGLVHSRLHASRHTRRDAKPKRVDTLE